ncbi:HpcH/HpaI aldolase/citrate lyase family protein [Streptomyces sp. NPDC021080]|uniref:HpcH/HpaI aldolase/citrate lyase family protein n=1 Tax=Streptomyces sp. NPDC021080 TaxID=3365110 RepID=UPI0037B36C5F
MHTPAFMRSMLSVPGIRERFITKAEDSPADAVLLDLEDSVADADKAAARTLVADYLPRFPKRGRQLFVRPNGLDTGLLEQDLTAVVNPALDGVHLPKVHDPDVLLTVDHYLTLLERTRGMSPGSVQIIAWIESAAGLARVESICRAAPRLIGVSLGSEDYTASLGVQRTREAGELEYARARVANAAAAAGIGAMDGPEADYRDSALFESQARHARSLGFRGKYCIHPDQVPMANQVFSPDKRELSWARRVVEAYQEGERQGLGAVGLDGAMVDRPVYLRAVELLSRSGD